MRGIPWDLILKQAPVLIDVASSLAASSRERSAQTAATANTVNELRDQVAKLVEGERAQAALLEDLAKQLGALSQAAEVTATRVRQALVLGSVAFVVGAVALVLVHLH